MAAESKKPYLTDTNGQKTYEGAQIFKYQEDEMTPVYGILQRTSADDPNVVMYPWSVNWECEGLQYWTGILPLWTGNKPDPIEDLAPGTQVP